MHDSDFSCVQPIDGIFVRLHRVAQVVQGGDFPLRECVERNLVLV